MSQMSHSVNHGQTIFVRSRFLVTNRAPGWMIALMLPAGDFFHVIGKWGGVGSKHSTIKTIFSLIEWRRTEATVSLTRGQHQECHVVVGHDDTVHI